MPATTARPTVELLFPVWVRDPRPEALGSRVPRWAVQLDGRTIDTCTTRVEAERAANLLRTLVALGEAL